MQRGQETGNPLSDGQQSTRESLFCQECQIYHMGIMIYGHFTHFHCEQIIKIPQNIQTKLQKVMSQNISLSHQNIVSINNRINSNSIKQPRNIQNQNSNLFNSNINYLNYNHEYPITHNIINPNTNQSNNYSIFNKRTNHIQNITALPAVFLLRPLSTPQASTLKSNLHSIVPIQTQPHRSHSIQGNKRKKFYIQLYSHPNYSTDLNQSIIYSHCRANVNHPRSYIQRRYSANNVQTQTQYRQTLSNSQSKYPNQFQRKFNKQTHFHSENGSQSRNNLKDVVKDTRRMSNGKPINNAINTSQIQNGLPVSSGNSNYTFGNDSRKTSQHKNQLSFQQRKQPSEYILAQEPNTRFNRMYNSQASPVASIPNIKSINEPGKQISNTFLKSNATDNDQIQADIASNKVVLTQKYSSNEIIKPFQQLNNSMSSNLATIRQESQRIEFRKQIRESVSK